MFWNSLYEKVFFKSGFVLLHYVESFKPWKSEMLCVCCHLFCLLGFICIVLEALYWKLGNIEDKVQELHWCDWLLTVVDCAVLSVSCLFVWVVYVSTGNQITSCNYTTHWNDYLFEYTPNERNDCGIRMSARNDSSQFPWLCPWFHSHCIFFMFWWYTKWYK